MFKTAIVVVAGMGVSGTLYAQAKAKTDIVYQQAGVIAATTMGGGVGTMGFFSADAPGGTPVTGSPYAAQSEHHSLQTLGDGTRIEQTETAQVSRDSQGRTRTEAFHAAGESAPFVTIDDPVAGVRIMLNTQNQTASRMSTPKGLTGLPPMPPLPGLPGAPEKGPVMTFRSGGGTSAAIEAAVAGSAGPHVMITRVETNMPRPTSENLGIQTVNGVAATGTRTTMTIPAGQIGNNRPIQVTSERWYSDDLQTVVKSSNSDPRFGDTTFELTNISRGEPDPSLFQIPSGYTVTDSKAMTVINGVSGSASTSKE